MAEWESWNFHVLDPLKFTMPVREVTRIFLHCSAWDGDLKGVALVQEFNRWHLLNGWAGIGYHGVIDKTGTLCSARPFEREGAAQLGKDNMGNHKALAFCTNGNWNFTTASMEAVLTWCKTIDAAYKLANKPVTFHGHCEIDPRPCPIYDYKGLLGLDVLGNLGAMPFVDPADVAARATTAGKHE